MRGAVLGTVVVLFVSHVAAAQGAAKGTASSAGDDAPDATPEAEPESVPPEVDTTLGPAADEPPPPITEPQLTWKPYGFLRLQYRIVRNDPNVIFIGRDDGFELQNARIGVLGSLGTRVRYNVAIDGAVDERQQINVPEGKLRVGLRDAYADVAVSGSIAVRAGYFETLVDPDLDADIQREFVDRPIESRGVRATEGYQTQGLPPGRSLGAALRLDPGRDPTGAAGPRIGFELAVQNGADEYASNNDNDTPAASASVFVRLPKESWVVASARFNRRTDGELPFRRDEDDIEGSFGAKLNAGPVSVGAGVVFVRTMFPTTASPVQNAFGAHGQLMVRAGVRLAVGYRFGILDPSSLFLTDRVIEHTVGAVLGVPALHMRLQVQVTHVQEQGARDLTNDRAQIAAELAL